MTSTSTTPLAEQSEFDLVVDPFNQAPKGVEKSLLQTRVAAARTDGRLNLAAIGLQSIPDEVLRMYEPADGLDADVDWSQCVDVSRLFAADNELAVLDGNVFPDDDDDADDEKKLNGRFLRGLELLDLHGNVLTRVPCGLRRLERLRILNLVSGVDH